VRLPISKIIEIKSHLSPLYPQLAQLASPVNPSQNQNSNANSQSSVSHPHLPQGQPSQPKKETSPLMKNQPDPRTSVNPEKKDDKEKLKEKEKERVKEEDNTKQFAEAIKAKEVALRLPPGKKQKSVPTPPEEEISIKKEEEVKTAVEKDLLNFKPKPGKQKGKDEEDSSNVEMVETKPSVVPPPALPSVAPPVAQVNPIIAAPIPMFVQPERFDLSNLSSLIPSMRSLLSERENFRRFQGELKGDLSSFLGIEEVGFVNLKTKSDVYVGEDEVGEELELIRWRDTWIVDEEMKVIDNNPKAKSEGKERKRESHMKDFDMMFEGVWTEEDPSDEDEEQIRDEDKMDIDETVETRHLTANGFPEEDDFDALEMEFERYNRRFVSVGDRQKWFT
jgi:hypothetical protein